ncbi:MAG: 2Fe-2S iron-sulfur cluster-binding protein [Candidatus Bathyarchaeia archaeon]
MKKTFTFTIDDREVEAEEGMTILETAKKSAIEVPTLCHNEELEPYGACRICSVEIERKGRTSIVAACCYPAEPGLEVRTRTPKIDKIRKTVLELAAASAGEEVTGKMRELASEYKADLSRFRSKNQTEPTKCILCGLCVRYCVNMTWDSAIGFVGRGAERKIALFPEKSAICTLCNDCHPLCPTGRITSIGPDPPFPAIDDVLAGRE